MISICSNTLYFPRSGVRWLANLGALQKFASIHAAIHNHFDLDGHLTGRPDFKMHRDRALADWCQLAA